MRRESVVIGWIGTGKGERIVTESYKVDRMQDTVITKVVAAFPSSEWNPKPKEEHIRKDGSVLEYCLVGIRGTEGLELRVACIDDTKDFTVWSVIILSLGVQVTSSSSLRLEDALETIKSQLVYNAALAFASNTLIGESNE